jgi:hypothetical protein
MNHTTSMIETITNLGDIYNLYTTFKLVLGDLKESKWIPLLATSFVGLTFNAFPLHLKIAGRTKDTLYCVSNATFSHCLKHFKLYHLFVSHAHQ